MTLAAQPLTMAFYHVAAMNHWREVVAEQLGVLARAGFDGLLQITFSAGCYAERYIREVCRAKRLRYEIHEQNTGLDAFEFPAVRLLKSVCDQGFDGHVLYFHTKAVSHPGSWERMMWRWAMNAWCLAQWRQTERRLAASEADAAGGFWCPSSWPSPCFAGTFWHAKASYIRSLPAVDDYRSQFLDLIAQRNPWGCTDRHAAEFWVNARNSCRPIVYGPVEAHAWDHNWWTAHPGLVAHACQHGS